MNKNQIELYLNFAEKYHTNSDPAHDFNHILRIVKRLDFLSEGFTGLNYPLLYFLACFHGLNNINDEVRNFLASLGWAGQEIDAGIIGLKSHLENPLTAEEKIVHDANYIELLGAFGVAKAFTTGGFRGQSYEETIAIFESQYLYKIEFQTPHGRKLAAEGQAYAKTFIKRLKDELQ